MGEKWDKSHGIRGDSSLVRRGTSPNSPRVKDRVRVRVRNRDKLHLWLWRPPAMAD